MFVLGIQINLGYIWLLAALFLLMLELSVPGLFFFIAFSIGCIAASLSAFYVYPLVTQCLIFLITSVLSFLGLKRIFSAHVTENKHSRTNYVALIGRAVVVVVDIEPGSDGRVKVGGEVWPARSSIDQNFKKGDFVTVVRVEGNRLIVKA